MKSAENKSHYKIFIQYFSVTNCNKNPFKYYKFIAKMKNIKILKSIYTLNVYSVHNIALHYTGARNLSTRTGISMLYIL